MIEKPILIDELISKDKFLGACQSEINGRWYIAKPYPYYGWRNTKMKIYHAWLVLKGDAMAWQYAEDRKPKTK
jgi:hypothetical protein